MVLLYRITVVNKSGWGSCKLFSIRKELLFLTAVHYLFRLLVFINFWFDSSIVFPAFGLKSSYFPTLSFKRNSLIQLLKDLIHKFVFPSMPTSSLLSQMKAPIPYPYFYMLLRGPFHATLFFFFCPIMNTAFKNWATWFCTWFLILLHHQQ